MKNKNWITGFAAIFFAVGLAASTPEDTWGAEIPKGVFVGDYDLGGMSDEEASKAIEDYVAKLASQTITLDIDGTRIETTAGELGFHWSNPDAVEQAVNAIPKGNLIKRYMALKDLETDTLMIPLETGLNEESVTAFVSERGADATVAARNASIQRVNGAFEITQSEEGRTVDIEATLTALNNALNNGLDEPILVNAVVTTDAPSITTEMLSTIQDTLGAYSTNFSSSGAARSKNLSVGAAKINGRVLLPGETLSGYECMQPFTTANGYATAAAYENGMVVDSVGGGVCQIATTLYNAALRAELEITQRQNHSMVVGYVPHSADAAIAGTYKDIKITNNYTTPIYIEGYTSGRNLYFTVYGKETRPENRKVEFVSETLKVTDPGEPVIKQDNSLAPGARVTEQSAHKGVKSRLWKVVTENGVETERTLLHSDTYNPSKAIVRVGPPAAPVEVPAETAPVETAPVETEPAPASTGEDGGPGV